MFEKIDLASVLNENLILQFGTMFKCVTIPAKTILLPQNDVATKVYWIKKGCIRVWFEHEGDDITFQFFTENNLVASMESFWKGVPSHIAIETVECCEVLVADKSDIDNLIQEALQIEQYRDLFINVIFDRTFDYMKHSLSFIKLTPEQRYLKFVAERPELIQRIPQYLIASYLGVSKVHLSRIKSKLAKQ